MKVVDHAAELRQVHGQTFANVVLVEAEGPLTPEQGTAIAQGLNRLFARKEHGQTMVRLETEQPPSVVAEAEE